MKLSVVIPTRNRLDILRQSLACLLKQNLPADLFEVIVVDDASVDGTENFLSRYAAPFSFRHFRQEEPGGPAQARNVGILAAKGTYVVILNDDALLASDALSVHLLVHEGLQDQNVSVLGRFDLPEDFSATLWGYVLQNSDLLFRYPALEHNGIYGYEQYWSCNISTPRLALLKAGLFDEAFTGGAWGAEDQELGRRLLDLGVPVLFRSDCKATHCHYMTVEGFEGMSLSRGAGGVRLFAKHNISCHYAGQITDADVLFWRNLPARLRRAADDFQALLKQTETLVPPQCAVERPYFCRDDYPEAVRLAYSLFYLRTRELLAVFSMCAEKLEDLLEGLESKALNMEQAAARLYPLCLILRYYYDSIGICSTEQIRDFTSLNAARVRH